MEGGGGGCLLSEVEQSAMLFGPKTQKSAICKSNTSVQTYRGRVPMSTKSVRPDFQQKSGGKESLFVSHVLHRRMFPHRALLLRELRPSHLIRKINRNEPDQTCVNEYLT